MSSKKTKTIPIYILCLPGLQILDIAGPIQALSACNKEENLIDDTKNVELIYISTLCEIKSNQELFLSNLKPLPSFIKDSGVLIVPGVSNVVESESFDFVSKWIKENASNFKKIVSVCTGAFYLGKAGLLNGKSCTTHHNKIKTLENYYPLANVYSDRIFIEDDNIITSAGIAAGIDVTLHLIESIFGYKCAVNVANDLVVYMRRTSNDRQLSEWFKYRNHINPQIHKVQNLIMDNPAYDWTADELGNKIGMSPRNLNRVFKNKTGNTIQEYHYSLRIELAKRFLEMERYSIEIISDKVGFKSVKTFRRTWKKIMKDLPSNYN